MLIMLDRPSQQLVLQQQIMLSQHVVPHRIDGMVQLVQQKLQHLLYVLSALSNLHVQLEMPPLKQIMYSLSQQEEWSNAIAKYCNLEQMFVQLHVAQRQITKHVQLHNSVQHVDTHHHKVLFQQLLLIYYH